MNTKILSATLLAAAFLSSTVRSQGTADPVDIQVGKSGGKVAWSTAGFVPGSRYNPLFRADKIFHGWSHNNPGFDHARTASGGVSPLTAPPQPQIWLEVISLDPALLVGGPGLSYLLEFPGDRGFLGDTTLHQHLTWIIDEDDPGFVPDQCVWEGTFRLVDTGAGLGPSLPFTLLFANVPVRGGEFPPTPTAADGDFDEDNDVDWGDYNAFPVCLAGPELRSSPDNPAVTTCEVDCHNAFDFDDDLDIDLIDFADFQAAFGQP